MSLSIDEYKEFELDVYKTLISNILGFMFLITIIIFMIFSLTYINQLQENQKIMGLIVFMFIVLNLLKMIHFNFEYQYIKKEVKKQ